jgi:hypothetical protein
MEFMIVGLIAVLLSKLVGVDYRLQVEVELIETRGVAQDRY